MRELSDEYKLSIRTIAEVFDSLGTVVLRLAPDKTVRFRERGKVKRPTRAAVVSAMLLQLRRLPWEEQRRFISEGMDELNRLLGADDPPAAGDTEVVPGPPKKGGRKSAG